MLQTSEAGRTIVWYSIWCGSQSSPSLLSVNWYMTMSLYSLCVDQLATSGVALPGGYISEYGDHPADALHCPMVRPLTCALFYFVSDYALDTIIFIPEFNLLERSIQFTLSVRLSVRLSVCHAREVAQTLFFWAIDAYICKTHHVTPCTPIARMRLYEHEIKWQARRAYFIIIIYIEQH